MLNVSTGTKLVKKHNKHLTYALSETKTHLSRNQVSYRLYNAWDLFDSFVN